MGLYPQPNEWTCGPFALKHALATLGRIADENTIAEHARTHWWSGTDEIQLAKAAHACGCDLPLIRSANEERARRVLVDTLRRKIPVLLCVDDWEHWITVVRHHSGHFVIIDSNLDPVLSIVSWPQLRARWRYRDVDYDAEYPPSLYDLHPVEPRFRVSVKADFSEARVRHLRRAENWRLARYWSVYLEDLLEICRPPAVQMVRPLSMGEFLRRNQDLIVSRVVYWHGEIKREEVRRLLVDYRFVAETYGLVIPEAKVRRAVADLAILATMWAIANRGLGEFYGVEPK